MPFPVGIYVTKCTLSGRSRWMLYLENPVAELAGDRKFAHRLNSWEADPRVATRPYTFTGKRLVRGAGGDSESIAVGELQNAEDFQRYKSLVDGICNHNEISYIFEALRRLTEAKLAWDGAFSIVANKLTDRDPFPHPPQPPTRIPAAPTGRAPSRESLRQAASLGQDFGVVFGQPSQSSRDGPLALPPQDRASIGSAAGPTSTSLQRSIQRANERFSPSPPPPQDRASIGSAAGPASTSLQQAIQRANERFPLSRRVPGGVILEASESPHQLADWGFSPATVDISGNTVTWKPGATTGQASRDPPSRRSGARDGGALKTPMAEPAAESPRSRGVKLAALATPEAARSQPKPHSAATAIGSATVPGSSAGSIPAATPAGASMPIKVEPTEPGPQLGFTGPRPWPMTGASGSAPQEQPGRATGAKRWGPPKNS